MPEKRGGTKSTWVLRGSKGCIHYRWWDAPIHATAPSDAFGDASPHTAGSSPSHARSPCPPTIRPSVARSACGQGCQARVPQRCRRCWVRSREWVDAFEYVWACVAGCVCVRGRACVCVRGHVRVCAHMAVCVHARKRADPDHPLLCNAVIGREKPRRVGVCTPQRQRHEAVSAPHRLQWYAPSPVCGTAGVKVGGGARNVGGASRGGGV